MMHKSPKARAVTAVLLSYAVLRAAGALLSPMTGEGGYLQRQLPYAAGFLSAITVMLLCGRYLTDTCVREETVLDGGDTAESRKKPPYAVLSVIAAVLLFTANLIYSAAAGRVGVPEMEDYIIKLAAGTLIKPAAEEYLFRTLYLRSLISSGIRPRTAVLLQAVLFSLSHDLSAAPFTLFAGILLGALAGYAEEKNSFKAAYAAHAIYNGVLYLIWGMTGK